MRYGVLRRPITPLTCTMAASSSSLGQPGPCRKLSACGSAWARPSWLRRLSVSGLHSFHSPVNREGKGGLESERLCPEGGRLRMISVYVLLLFALHVTTMSRGQVPKEMVRCSPL